MAKQQLHSGLAPIDVLTRTELEETLHKGMDGMLRDRYRGMDFIKIPAQFGAGTGGTITLNSGGTTDPYCGPEQGDFWMLNRAVVVSSLYATDPAKYILFRGGTPSDPSNALSNRYLLNGQAFAPATTYTTMTAPTFPASGVAAQNTTNQPYTVVISGGTATQTTVNGVPVGGGDGTYVVPAYGSIAVTYSVAPTWTWTATQTSSAAQLGQNQGIAYDPGQKKVYLEPGDQLYAQVFNTTVGATYILSGEATRVPAEMKGKIL